MIPTSSGALHAGVRARAARATRAPRRARPRVDDHREHHLQRALGRDPADRPQLHRRAARGARARAAVRGGRGTGWPRAPSEPPAAACRRRRRACGRSAGRPASSAAIAASVCTCSSSEGSSGRSRNRNSVRSSPTPSAPISTAVEAWPAPPRFAKPRSRCRRASPPARSRARGRRACARPPRRRASARRTVCASSGETSTVPASPSSSSGVPSGIASTAPPSPTTAGIPSARARIAAWAVAVPRAVAMAWTSSGSSAAVSRGVSSSATTIPGSTKAGPRFPAPQRREHPASDVVDVGRALGQQIVAERPPLRSRLRAGGVPGGLRRVAAVDQRPRAPRQRLVVEQREVRGEDLGLLRGAAPGDLVAVLLDGLAGRGQRLVEARQLDLGPLRLAMRRSRARGRRAARRARARCPPTPRSRCSTAPAGGAGVGAASGATGARGFEARPRPSATPSPNPPAASSSSAATASLACGPDAVATSRSPLRAIRVIRPSGCAR